MIMDGLFSDDRTPLAAPAAWVLIAGDGWTALTWPAAAVEEATE